jgi:hypothetical protein
VQNTLRLPLVLCLGLVASAGAPLRADEVVSKDKGIRVAFPAAPREMPPPQLGVEVTGFKQWLAEIGQRVFLVAVTDWKALRPDDDELLDVLRQGTLSGMPGGKLVAERYIMVDGRPGRELEVDTGNHRGITRLVLDRGMKRSVQIMSAAPAADPPGPAVAAFFESLHFLGPRQKAVKTPKDRSFSATFSAPFAERIDAIPQGQQLTVTSESGGHTFTAMRIAVKTPLDGDAEQRLDNSRDGMLKRVKAARLVSETPLTVGGFPARDVQVEAAGNLVMFGRVILDAKRQRVFLLAAAARKPRADVAAATAFFDTFRIDDSKAIAR